MTAEEQGRQLKLAMIAVRQMQSDVARMLRDLDRWMDKDGYRPAHGSFVTTDLTYDIKKGMYMAEGLFRHYVRTEALNESVSVHVMFIDGLNKVCVPQLIAAKTLYATPWRLFPEKPDKARTWEAWDAWHHWEKMPVVGTTSWYSPASETPGCISYGNCEYAAV